MQPLPRFNVSKLQRINKLVFAAFPVSFCLPFMNPALIIVPTYNERENLPRIVPRLLSLSVKVDVLVVDGNSSDGTGQIADELAAKHPEVQVLHETNKNGLGRAYLAGFKWALERGYEFVFEMDGDVSHDPDDVPKFLEAASKQNADLVLGSRYTGGVRVLNWPLKRLLLSRCAGIYVWLVTGMPFTDPTGGYKCFRRRALQAINLDAVKSDGYSFQIEMTHRLWRAGFRVVEVPITFTERVEGSSKLTHHIINEAFWMVWRLWLQNGLPAQTPGKNLNICRAIPSKTENLRKHHENEPVGRFCGCRFNFVDRAGRRRRRSPKSATRRRCSPARTRTAKRWCWPI